ncbi:MAG: hypothetical protein HFI47_01625 [Lachnospiraceae bacterium]|nr:hypothetical protein [Lachnospiraceae bacterium]
MKKIWFMLASVVVLNLYLNYNHIREFLSGDVMGAKVLSMEEIDELCEGREEIRGEAPITLNGGKIAYDEEQNMLLIPQKLQGDFEGRLWAGEGRLYLAWDEGLEDKDGAMRENRVFRLFHITDTSCWMYNVYFTGMPVMEIRTAREDGQGEFLGDMWVVDPYHSALQNQSCTASWHKRGATSANYEKASYRLTLTGDKLSLLGMRRDDDWILHALYDDDGLIHNKLSYEVWREIAQSNDVPGDEGISMEYVELFVDGRYQGVYGLSERIDQKSLQMEQEDVLYKCRDQVPPGEDDFYSELTEEMNPVFEMKYPKSVTQEAWEPLRLWTSIFLTDRSYSFEEGKEILDMENAVDYNLFNLLICGMDNIMKNIYFRADYQEDGDYRFVKIPWDLNMTWGSSWIDDISCNFNRYQEKNIDSPNGWTEDMYVLYEQNPEEIGGLLAGRWEQLREGIITKESLLRKADTEIEYLRASGAAVRNGQRWPPQNDYWKDEYLYEYIDGRIDFLDEYIGQMR